MMRDFLMSVIPLKGASIRGNDALPEINPALEVLSKYLKLYKSNGGQRFYLYNSFKKDNSGKIKGITSTLACDTLS